MKPNSKPLLFDAIVIAVAVALLVVSIGVSELLCRWAISDALKLPIFPETLMLLSWLNCGGRIIYPLTGEMISGYLLGRYLRRMRPHSVIAGLGLYSVAVMAYLLTVVDRRRTLWIDAVGYGVAALQLVLEIAAMLAAVGFGVWCGRKQRAHVTNRSPHGAS